MDSNNATSIAPHEDNLPDKLSREDLFIQNLFICDTPKDAALAAGYSESYAVTTIRYRLQNPKFLDKIREYARQHELIDSVPKIMKIEQKALDYLAKENTKATEIPKFAAMLKQKKMVAGLIQAETTHNVTTINIREAQNLMINASGNANPGISSDADAAK